MERELSPEDLPFWEKQMSYSYQQQKDSCFIFCATVYMTDLLLQEQAVNHTLGFQAYRTDTFPSTLILTYLNLLFSIIILPCLTLTCAPMLCNLSSNPIQTANAQLKRTICKFMESIMTNHLSWLVSLFSDIWMSLLLFEGLCWLPECIRDVQNSFLLHPCCLLNCLLLSEHLWDLEWLQQVSCPSSP